MCSPGRIEVIIFHPCPSLGPVQPLAPGGIPYDAGLLPVVWVRADLVHDGEGAVKQ